MFRKKKIGVLGAANSGKTVLLTSLLWHLEAFSPEKFHVGSGQVGINDFEYDKKHSRFNYPLHKEIFVNQGGWPDKTTDYAIAKCSYKRTDSIWQHDMTFIDIPGERVSDVLIWTSEDYADWSRQLSQFWSGNKLIQHCMQDFVNNLKGIVINNTPSELDLWNYLVAQYKNGLIKLGKNYSPFITPSTFVLTADGKTIDENLSGKEVEKELLRRPIWEKGDFFPLPVEWKKCKNITLKNIYKKCKANFKRYRKEVLKPLYAEIDDCDNFLVCVDIFNILASGPGRFYQVRGEFDNFFEMIRPGRFCRRMIDIQKALNAIKVGKLLPNSVQAKPPKIAFVATKSDMAYDSDEKNKLLKLLERFVNSATNTSYVNSSFFTCCSGRSIIYDYKSDKIVFLKEVDSDGEGSRISEVHLPVDKWPALPDGWKCESDWDISLYREFTRPRFPLCPGYGEPPEQDNLDRLFDFITED